MLLDNNGGWCRRAVVSCCPRGLERGLDLNHAKQLVDTLTVTLIDFLVCLGVFSIILEELTGSSSSGNTREARN